MSAPTAKRVKTEGSITPAAQPPMRGRPIVPEAALRSARRHGTVMARSSGTAGNGRPRRAVTESLVALEVPPGSGGQNTGDHGPIDLDLATLSRLRRPSFQESFFGFLFRYGEDPCTLLACIQRACSTVVPRECSC